MSSASKNRALRSAISRVRKRLGIPKKPFLQPRETLAALGLRRELAIYAVRLGRISTAAYDWKERRAVARKIKATSKYASLIDKQTGYYLFRPGVIPGAMEAVSSAAAVFSNKKLDHANSKKPFFSNLLEPQDLEQHPAILEFAESQPMMEAAAGYLGVLPKLHGLGIYFSPANESLKSSQKYHIDGDELSRVKCFINVNNVGPENGPFTFIPANKSHAIRRKLGQEWERLEDNEVESLSNPGDVISLVGAPGTGALVDTARCLHYGSRCRIGYRLVLMFHYTLHPPASRNEDGKHMGTALLLNDNS